MSTEEWGYKISYTSPSEKYDMFYTYYEKYDIRYLYLYQIHTNHVILSFMLGAYRP